MSLFVSTAQYLTKVGITTDPATFGLQAARNESTGVNTLTWTWPPRMVAGFSSGVVFWQLTLQRSNSASNRPNSLVVYDVASRKAPAVDAHWADVTKWNFNQFQTDPAASAGTGYSDRWPTSNGAVAYRLILNFAKIGDPVLPPYGELTWNVRLIVPPITLNCRTDSLQPRLTWNTLDVLWWP